MKTFYRTFKKDMSFTDGKNAVSRAGNAKDAEIVAKKLLAYIEKLE